MNDLLYLFPVLPLNKTYSLFIFYTHNLFESNDAFMYQLQKRIMDVFPIHYWQERVPNESSAYKIKGLL